MRSAKCTYEVFVILHLFIEINIKSILHLVAVFTVTDNNLKRLKYFQYQDYFSCIKKESYEKTNITISL